MREFLLQLLAQEEDFVSNEDDFFFLKKKKLQEFEGMFAEPKGFSPNITHDH